MFLNWKNLHWPEEAVLDPPTTTTTTLHSYNSGIPSRQEKAWKKKNIFKKLKEGFGLLSQK